MTRPFRNSHYARQAPAPRRMTDAQVAANRRAFDKAPATIEGRYSKGDLIQSYDGRVWKVVSRGIRYHEDVHSALYGVAPVVRPPATITATLTLRAAIETVLIPSAQPRLG